MCDAEKQHVTLHWKNIYVRTAKGRPLLEGVSGVGGVYANGQELGSAMTGVCGYVQQEDLFLGTLTVEEHLTIQALMRLSGTMDARQRARRVEEVMRSMLLDNARGSRIGTPGVKKGISGGELKRLAFATVLLKQPPLLFCDEPTTGLDSHMSAVVVKRLEMLAANGMTVVCTIHQPNAETFEIFDKVNRKLYFTNCEVVFLCQGRIAFIGSPLNAVHFFGSAGYLLPERTNPANFFINTLAFNPDHPKDSRERGTKICDAFAKSEYKQLCDAQIEEAARPRQLHAIPPPGLIILFFALWKRYLIDNYRTPSVVAAKFAQKAFMGLFLGLLYYQHWKYFTTQNGVQNLKGSLFYYISELTYATLYGIQSYLPGDFPLLIREYHDGIFPTSAYYVARLLSYVPIFSIDGILFVSISYWFIGFSASITRFMLTLFVGLLVELSSASLGIMICSVTPSYSIAIAVSGPVLTLFSLTGGIFTNVSVMPDWSRWIQYLSWFRYAYEALIVNEWSNPIYSHIPCVMGSNRAIERNVSDAKCLHNGDEVIRSLNFSKDNLLFNLAVMPLGVVVIYTMGYIGLVVRVRKAR
ncbi:unnamed protein product, partial [Mesorhabditis spiculigera]